MANILAPKPPPSPGPGPNPSPGPQPPGENDDGAGAGGLPDGLKLFFGIAIVGAIAQGLYHVNSTAGWMFAFLVVLGYLAAGDAKTVGSFIGAIRKLVGA